MDSTAKVEKVVKLPKKPVAIPVTIGARQPCGISFEVSAIPIRIPKNRQPTTLTAKVPIGKSLGLGIHLHICQRDIAPKAPNKPTNSNVLTFSSAVQELFLPTVLQ